MSENRVDEAEKDIRFCEMFKKKLDISALRKTGGTANPLPVEKEVWNTGRQGASLVEELQRRKILECLKELRYIGEETAPNG